MCDICRRGFLTGAGALGIASVASPLLAASGVGASPARRGNYLIRGATVLTMDRTLGTIEGGSVHIRDSKIVAVAKNVEAPGARIIDGRGAIVLPGLIDTHFHTWQTLFRSFGGTTPQTAYFPSLHHFAAGMRPEDMYAATRLAATEALNAGVTTIHDWCHNIRSRDHATEDVRALSDTGIRARWSFGQAEDQRPDETIRLGDLTALAGEWPVHGNGGLIRLGMAWRGMYRGGSWIPEAVYRKELDTARGLNLPITTHTGTLAKSVGHIEKHFRAGLLGPDINIVHACSASAAEIQMIKQAGSSVSSLPMTEMVGGWGFPKLGECLAAGVPVALGLDTSVLAGSTNMFKLMQFAMAAVNGGREDELALKPADVLELGTIRAARVLGIDSDVGSLAPGKRGDLIMVRTDHLGAGVVAEPHAVVVESTSPEQVDTVFIDGKLVKRGGKLLGVDPTAIVDSGRRSSIRVRERMQFG